MMLFRIHRQLHSPHTKLKYFGTEESDSSSDLRKSNSPFKKPNVCRHGLAFSLRRVFDSLTNRAVWLLQPPMTLTEKEGRNRVGSSGKLAQDLFGNGAGYMKANIGPGSESSMVYC